MFANLRQIKTQLHADVTVGSDDDGRVTLHVVVPTTYIRTPDQPGERAVRDALNELNLALQALGESRLTKLVQADVKTSAHLQQILTKAAEAGAQKAREDTVIAVLDAADLPASVGRLKARQALQEAGVAVGNEILRSALRRRQGRGI
jgi:hypothetical protein